MTDLRQDAQRALDAWDSTVLPVANDGMMQERMESLRAALEQPEQEPVAWMYPSDLEKFQRAETFAQVFSIKVGCPDEVSVPLYTTPPAAQPEQEPTQWRDMIVASLVREGVNKHRARELADHFAAQQQAEPFAWVFTPNNDLLWPHEVEVTNPIELNSYQPLYTAPPQQQAKMRMPKVGDKVICLEDESLGEVVSLTAGGSPDITFDDGTRGTYLLREFAELFGYVAPPQQQSEPPPERPWVGLTDEEIEAVVEQVANGKLVGTVQEFRIRFSRAIEAKLKEKNT